MQLLERINNHVKDFDKETKELAEQVGEEARKIFPQNNDIGRAVGELVKFLTRAATNPTGALQDLVRQIFCGFC